MNEWVTAAEITTLSIPMYPQKFFLACILLLSLLARARSWLVVTPSLMLAPLPLRGGSSPTNAVRLSAVPSNDDAASNDKKDDDVHNIQQQQQQQVIVVPQANYGVSFMGGDPCGSKYNDDPFDAAKGERKPGIPDDVKARIAALAEQKKKEMMQAKKEQ